MECKAQKRCITCDVLTAMAIVIFSSPIANTVALSDEITLNKLKDCDALMNAEKYLNSIGEVILYSGDTCQNCSLSYRVENGNICVVPVSWNVSSCSMEIEWHNLKEGGKVWNCSTTPTQMCTNNTRLSVTINAKSTNDDRFRIVLYQSQQVRDPTIATETKHKDTEEDIEKGIVVTFGAGFYIGITLGFLLCIVLIGLTIMKYKKRCHPSQKKKVSKSP